MWEPTDNVSGERKGTDWDEPRADNDYGAPRGRKADRNGTKPMSVSEWCDVASNRRNGKADRFFLLGESGFLCGQCSCGVSGQGDGRCVLLLYVRCACAWTNRSSQWLFLSGASASDANPATATFSFDISPSSNLFVEEEEPSSYHPPADPTEKKCLSNGSLQGMKLTSIGRVLRFFVVFLANPFPTCLLPCVYFFLLSFQYFQRFVLHALPTVSAVPTSAASFRSDSFHMFLNLAKDLSALWLLVLEKLSQAEQKTLATRVVNPKYSSSKDTANKSNVLWRLGKQTSQGKRPICLRNSYTKGITIARYVYYK